MAFLDYLTGEVGEDWVDGLITRRDALRRLALLGLSASAASALLAACAAADRATPALVGPSSSLPRASAGPSGVAVSGAPAGGVPSGEAVTFAGPRSTLQGFFAPAARPKGAMLVVHENRGLNDHIRSVAARLAGDGFSALAIDLLSEEGGTDQLGQGKVQAVLGAATPERLVGDMRAGLDELARRVPDAKLGVVGFCFGGGMVWTLLDAGDPRLAVAIPFYGPTPAAPDFSGEETAVLAVYAELDSRVNASRDTARKALEAAGLTHEIKTYPGVDHAFFNDTGGRYSPDQAAAAYADVLAWLGQHLAG